MRKINNSIVFILFLAPVFLTAQITVDSMLVAVEKNNTTLMVMRKALEAKLVENKTGLYLQNPEVGFNYLWSSPASIGNRTDVNLRQSFDYPTAYGLRSRISDIRNEQDQLDYLAGRRDIFSQVRSLYADLLYIDKLIAENAIRETKAREIAEAYGRLYQNGQLGILEYNKVQLNSFTITKTVETLSADKALIIRQLMALNGGKDLPAGKFVEDRFVLPADFSTWYKSVEERNPEFTWLQKEASINEQEVKLSRALALPKSSAGYMSERIVGERFQGVTLGISIPMWENKNKVKSAKAQGLVLKEMQIDKKNQLFSQLKAEYDKAVSLQKTIDEYSQMLTSLNSPELLKKALDKGEISLITYLLELSFSYSAIDNFLSYEHELNRKLAVLASYQ
jgi:outer membrane protein TolC